MRRHAPSNHHHHGPQTHSPDPSSHYETGHHQDTVPVATPRNSDDQSAMHELQLFTPSAAAEILAVKESWLRRKAGTRSIPCTFLGRHLRFSVEDLRAITHQGAQPLARRRGRPRSR